MKKVRHREATAPHGPSLEVRIAQHITADGSAIIPPRIARWLEQNSGITADRRIRLRDNDPDAYVALAALHLSAQFRQRNRSRCRDNRTRNN